MSRFFLGSILRMGLGGKYVRVERFLGIAGEMVMPRVPLSGKAHRKGECSGRVMIDVVGNGAEVDHRTHVPYAYFGVS